MDRLQTRCKTGPDRPGHRGNMHPKCRRGAVAVLVSAVLAGAPGRAHAGLREQAAVQDLRTRSGATVVVMTDPLEGHAIAMRGLRQPLAPAGRDASAAALQWCRDHAAALGLRDDRDELRLRGVEARRSGVQRITLEQWYAGLPVLGADCRVLVDAEGRMYGFASGLRPGLELDVTPTVSESQALVTAANASGFSLAEQTPTVRLVVRSDDTGAWLAYEVVSRAPEGRPVRSFIDARSGALRVRDEGIAHAAGLVFRTDPRGPLTQVELPALGSSVSLASRLLRIEDSLEPAAAADGNGDFLLTPGQTGFDQVNAYYHVSHFLEDVLVGHLGMTPLRDSLVVRVQFRTEPFVAFTSGRFIFLGRPITGFVQQVARAADIVVHEAVHAVLYDHDIQPTGPRREAGALHEGLADYFAAAVTGDPAIGEWLYLPFPAGTTRVDMPLPLWHQSNYDHVGFAGGEAASPWGNGMILSATLWDLRGAIGEAADSLVVEALDALPSAPEWGHLANAMLLADDAHHAGRFQDAITQAFMRRGIRGAIEAAIAVVGPNTLRPGQTGEFTTTGCCGGLPGTFEWRVRSWCRGGPCSEEEVVGQGPSLTLSPQADLQVRVRAIGFWGDTLESAPHSVGVRVPEIVIEGPRRVPRDTPAAWSARIAAVSPSRVEWTRRYSLDVFFDNLGTLDEVRFAPGRPFELTAKLTDGLGRVATQTVFVTTFVPGTVPATPRELASTTLLDAAGHAAQSRFDLPASGRIEAALYDVRGRLRVRLADVIASAGAYLVRWDATPLESGMYFLHLRLARHQDTTERVAIVR